MTTAAEVLRRAARQEQFLDVVSRDEAEARFRRHLTLAPLGAETVSLAQARGRVLAANVLAPVDVPGFDRAGVDGFALRAEDTGDADDEAPAVLALTPAVLTPGVQPGTAVTPLRCGALAGRRLVLVETNPVLLAPEPAGLP